MTGISESQISELYAREAIRDVIFRYCRAADRGHLEGIRDCYWPDGTDRHGIAEGPVENFLQWAAKAIEVTVRNIHQVHNILIEFKDGGAAVETYFSAFDHRPNADGVMKLTSLKGRYVDWFVCRNDVWKVKDRIVVFDWVEDLPLPEGSEQERFGHRLPMGESWPNDPVYKVG